VAQRSSTHSPWRQVSPAPQLTAAQLASHSPRRHTSSALHGDGSHASSTHSSATTSQSSPLGQPTPRQLSSTQRPSAGLHTVGSAQVTPSQGNVHSLLRQMHSGRLGSSGAHAVSPSTS